MEDWQQWQIQADQVAAQLNEQVRALEADHFAESADATFRGFWPRFRDLKERVRIAPAIRLEDKLDLERKLRALGSRAYKAQEGAYARSGERKDELLTTIGEHRGRAESAQAPRDLRVIRRELDSVRETFDSGAALVPADRQQVWDAWRSASQDVWTRLTNAWSENESFLRQLLDTARERLDAGQLDDARRGAGKFFESMRGREVRQDALNALKNEAESLRRQADEREEQKAAQRKTAIQTQAPQAIDSWKTDLQRNRQAEERLLDEVEALEQRVKDAETLLEQAMVRGTLVEKKRRLSEHQRAIKTLEQRIEGAEEAPLMSVG